MENKVGHKVPSEKDISKLLADLDSVASRLREWGVDLTTSQRTGALKFRDGGEAMARRVHDLAEREKVAVKGIPLDGIVPDLDVAAAASRIEEATTVLLRLASDTRIEAESEACQAFLAYYGRLSHLAETDPSLATELKPVTDFMSTGRRKPRPTST